jgi:Arc/MetJ-type ribon-helix-helix transcriptional regulator
VQKVNIHVELDKNRYANRDSVLRLSILFCEDTRKKKAETEQRPFVG